MTRRTPSSRPIASRRSFPTSGHARGGSPMRPRSTRCASLKRKVGGRGARLLYVTAAVAVARQRSPPALPLVHLMQTLAIASSRPHAPDGVGAAARVVAVHAGDSPSRTPRRAPTTTTECDITAHSICTILRFTAMCHRHNSLPILPLRSFCTVGVAVLAIVLPAPPSSALPSTRHPSSPTPARSSRGAAIWAPSTPHNTTRTISPTSTSPLRMLTATSSRRDCAVPSPPPRPAASSKSKRRPAAARSVLVRFALLG